MIEIEVQKLPGSLQEVGREVLQKLDEYFHEPVLVKPDKDRPHLWAFAVQTRLSVLEAESLFNRFFYEYWYEVGQPSRLTGILVTLEYLNDQP